MTHIHLADQTFTACPSGCLFWPTQKTLIVSDLHFEKGSSFATKGIFLPPHDTTATIEKLANACNTFTPETILFLGDVFHDTSSLKRMQPENRATLQSILDQHKIIWVEGNHDSGHAPEGITCHEHYQIDTITFTHIATDSHDPEISGHYHPSVKFKHKGQKVRRPCFITDPNKIILPSFGALTGGLDITDPVYTGIIGNDFDIYALGHKNVHAVPKAKIT